MSNREPSIGRRIFPALALTTVGVGMVQGLHRPVPGPATSGSPLMSSDGVATTVVPPVSVAPDSNQGGNVGTSGGVATPATSPAIAPATVPKTTVAPAAPSVCGALTGTGNQATIQWNRQYGVVQVVAKFTSDGTLCSAKANYQTYDSRSDRYESYAIPILNQQAASARSANIQGVSGATAVSQAYASSLQSAIDNKH